jgi:glycosyltransferase 2 family protein
LSLLFIGALAILFLHGHRVARALQRLLSGRSARLAQIVDDSGEALRQYARDWRSTGLALLLSIAIVGFAVGPIMLIAAAMPFAGPSSLDYGIAGLYALIANSLPVTPGGLGIGEGAFASACLMLAPQAARAAYGTIFLAFRCVFVLSTLPGLAAYLTSAARATTDRV